MKYESVCAGIEAFSQAVHDLDYTPVSFAEIDPSACAVLAQHYPHVPNRGDFTKQENSHDPIDLLVGGTPCQDFSVAGLRAGMDGARGQLTVEFAKLAGRKRPRWILWENVPGVMSIDGGRAFGTFLGLLGKLGYGFAYRVLDAQYFGVPQRRRRVFVVGYLGDWRRAAAVLFERHSLSGHPAPRREAGKGLTHELAPSLTGSGRGTERTGESRGQDPVIAVQVASTGDVSHCLNAGGMGRQDYETETETVIVTHALRADGFDASEDGTGRGTPLVPVIAPCLTQNYGKQPDNSDTSAGPMLIPVAVNLRGRDGGAMPELDDLASIRAASGGSSRSYVVGLDSQLNAEVEGIGPLTIGSASGGGQPARVATTMAVRRLTPRECERLQGFTDDYTLVKYRKVLKSGKLSKRLYTMADGPRYKMLGNSMAVPVIRWIAKRILEVDQIEKISV